MQIAQGRIKQCYDNKHTERTFEVGDWVYLKLQSYKQQFVHKKTNHKLTPRFYGSFQVHERIGSVAYKLKLPTAAKIHHVFLVSLLKKRIRDQVVVAAHLPPNVDPHNPRWYPRKILSIFIFKKGNDAVTKWLIQWLRALPEEATWEEATDIQKRFPDFQA